MFDTSVGRSLADSSFALGQAVSRGESRASGTSRTGTTGSGLRMMFSGLRNVSQISAHRGSQATESANLNNVPEEEEDSQHTSSDYDEEFEQQE
jgi:hypothetical protein